MSRLNLKIHLNLSYQFVGNIKLLTKLSYYIIFVLCVNNNTYYSRIASIYII